MKPLTKLFPDDGKLGVQRREFIIGGRAFSEGVAGQAGAVSCLVLTSSACQDNF